MTTLAQVAARLTSINPFIFLLVKVFIFGQKGLLYAFLYAGYIRVYPALIFKILTKKKNKTTLLT